MVLSDSLEYTVAARGFGQDLVIVFARRSVPRCECFAWTRRSFDHARPDFPEDGGSADELAPRRPGAARPRKSISTISDSRRIGANVDGTLLRSPKVAPKGFPSETLVHGIAVLRLAYLSAIPGVDKGHPDRRRHRRGVASDATEGPPGALSSRMGSLSIVRRTSMTKRIAPQTRLALGSVGRSREN
jgi:hypothetical protein